MEVRKPDGHVVVVCEGCGRIGREAAAVLRATSGWQLEPSAVRDDEMYCPPCVQRGFTPLDDL